MCLEKIKGSNRRETIAIAVIAVAGVITCNMQHSHIAGNAGTLHRQNKFLTFICMAKITFNYYPQFFTATILEWKHLLADDKMKEIVISSLQFLVNEGRVKIYSFVIMPNHIHLVWQIQDGREKAKVQQSFLKYTAQQMKFTLANTNTKELEKYKVKASDREYLPMGIGMGT